MFVKWKCFIYFQFWQSHIWVIQNIWNIMMSNNVSWMQIGCLFNVNVNAWFVQQQRASSYPCKGATKSQTGESHDVFLLFFQMKCPSQCFEQKISWNQEMKTTTKTATIHNLLFFTNELSEPTILTLFSIICLLWPQLNS